MTMKTGKLSAAELRERVFPHLGARPDVLVHAGIGQDCAILDFGPSVCVATCDPITGAGEHLGRLAVHIACNDLATSGAEPVGLLITLLLAESAPEADLDRFMREAGQAATALDVEIVGGHTEVTPGVARSIAVVSAIGRAPRHGFVSSRGGRPGDILVMTKTAGIEGTAILAADRADRLRPAVGEATLERARGFIDRISVVAEGRIGARCGASAMHDVTEGGVLTGAWETAEASACGVRFDVDAVPVAPETEAICAALGLDPLALISSGSMLIAVREPEPLLRELSGAGITGTVVGVLVDHERVIARRGESAPLVPPERDELWRILSPHDI
jgi:hydrogenase expression/formation protein HypE